MKKRIFSIVMAAMLTGSLATMGVFADTTTFGDGSAITGDNALQTPIIKVVVPTTVDFSVDTFEQKDAGTQIYSTENTIINKSNVAIKTDVAMSIAAKAGETVDFAEDAASVKTDTTASMWIAALPTKTALTTTNASSDSDLMNNAGTPAKVYAYIQNPTTKVITASTDGTEANIVYSTVAEVDTGATTFATGTGVAGFAMKYKDVDTTKGAYGTFASEATATTLSGTDSTVSFALAAADNYILEDGTRAAGAPVATGMSAFRFVGTVNPNATWAASMATVTVKYTINGIPATDFSALVANDYVTDAYQCLKPVVVTPPEDLTPKFTIYNPTTAAFTVTHLDAAKTYTIKGVYTDGTTYVNGVSGANIAALSNSNQTLTMSSVWKGIAWQKVSIYDGTTLIVEITKTAATALPTA